jgi:hypothetical protein
MTEQHGAHSAVRGFTRDSIWTTFERDRKLMEGATQDEWLATIELLCAGCRGWERVSQEQGRNLFAFFWDMPEWLRPEAWAKLIMAGRPSPDASGRPNLQAWAQSIHPFIVNQLVTGTFKVPVGAPGKDVKPYVSDKLRERIERGSGGQLVTLPANRAEAQNAVQS